MQTSHTLRFDQIARACQQLHGSLYDPVAQGVQLFGGGCRYRLEYWTLVGDAIDPIEKNTMEMDVKIGGGSKTLYEGDSAGLRFGACCVLSSVNGASLHHSSSRPVWSERSRWRDWKGIPHPPESL